MEGFENFSDKYWFVSDSEHPACT